MLINVTFFLIEFKARESSFTRTQKKQNKNRNKKGEDERKRLIKLN